MVTHVRTALLLGLGSTMASFLLLAGGRATVVGDDPGDEPPPSNVVRQGFPAARASQDLSKSETAWEVEWDLTHPMNRPASAPGCTFRIRSAKFMWKNKFGRPQWVTVARMVELAEIFVPYDNGQTAFLDIGHMGFWVQRARPEFLDPPCVAPGEVLKSSNPYWNDLVHKEVHDDGVRWMSAEGRGDRARRGEKLLLWGTYFGANYRYLIEFGFTDDGVMTCRMGPSGHNIFPRRSDRNDTHLHIGCWRMEPDLGDPVKNVGGPANNDYLLARRVFDEPNEKLTQVARAFGRNVGGDACEGNARWSAEEFTTIRVQSKVRMNSHGRPIAYDLISQRLGSVRPLHHEGTYGQDMDFVNYDFWVTRTEPGFTTYFDVPRYAAGQRPLAGHPATIWTCSPILHAARGEDFGPEDGTVNYTGLATVVWSGFMFKPRDLFDSTPLYKARSWGEPGEES